MGATVTLDWVTYRCGNRCEWDAFFKDSRVCKNNGSCIEPLKYLLRKYFLLSLFNIHIFFLILSIMEEEKPKS